MRDGNERAWLGEANTVNLTHGWTRWTYFDCPPVPIHRDCGRCSEHTRHSFYGFA